MKTDTIIDGRPVYEFGVYFKPVITTPTKVEVRANAVIFQNTGTSTVVLNQVWQIPAGGVFQFGDPGNLRNMIVQEFLVTFSNTGEQTDRLQVAELTMNDPRIAHYIDQNSRR